MLKRSVFLRAAVAGGVVALGLAGCAMMDRDDRQAFHATMTGAQEVPPAATAGTGQAEVRYTAGRDYVPGTLRWRVTYSGLTGPVVAGHIHGPAAPGQNAGVLIPFTNVGTSPITGEARLTAEQLAQLNAGQLYVNLHTQRYPGGEIRGQLLPR